MSINRERREFSKYIFLVAIVPAYVITPDIV